MQRKIDQLCQAAMDGDARKVRKLVERAPAVLLNAGPGTGKSRVLAARTAYVISNFDVRPEEVVILSFTKKEGER